MVIRNLYLFALILIFIGCGKPGYDDSSGSIDNSNPPAEGFNLQGSDEQAIALADSVMFAMGGRKAWDDTRTIAWNFFGARSLIWDKWTGDVRIDSYRDTTTYLLNINSMEGKVQSRGIEITDQAKLAELLQRGRSIWINDSYWLVMPFKLKDTGVTLRYLGDGETEQGMAAEILQLTFDNVGDTPDNKYHVWVSNTDNLVRQWAYFQYDTLSEPGFITPWQNYQEYGSILLSGDRGQRQITDISVHGELPEAVFSSFDPVDLSGIN